MLRAAAQQTVCCFITGTHLNLYTAIQLYPYPTIPTYPYLTLPTGLLPGLRNDCTGGQRVIVFVHAQQPDACCSARRVHSHTHRRSYDPRGHRSVSAFAVVHVRRAPGCCHRCLHLMRSD
jgi:hypothetical protein